MTETDRESIPAEAALLTDPTAVAEREAQNALEQYDRVLDLIDEAVRDGRPFRLRPSAILTLHRVATEGILRLSGSYRNTKVEISKSRHQPPEPFRVPELVEQMCDTVMENWQEWSAVQLAAYVMWRLNWIHPFDDGNGRTSRAVSYLILCIRAGSRLPGEPTIPEQIAADKAPYYRALETCDAAYETGEVDVSEMSTLLESYLAAQLLSLHEKATMSLEGDGAGRRFH